MIDALRSATYNCDSPRCLFSDEIEDSQEILVEIRPYAKMRPVHSVRLDWAPPKTVVITVRQEDEKQKREKGMKREKEAKCSATIFGLNQNLKQRFAPIFDGIYGSLTQC